ncbi:MAG: lasso peptide biosynthesis B2 protein [Henriciella sp.]|nr:lasso peptide biosynthesis B2 protein [Henriciella sp.]
MLIEALVRALVAMVMIRALPYRVWRRWLGEPVPLETIPRDTEVPGVEAREDLRDIYWAYASLNRHFRFLTCLMFGFSARALMRRRGFKSVMILGVERASVKLKPSLLAHAWVVYQSFDMAGGAEKPGYTAVAAYSIG